MRQPSTTTSCVADEKATKNAQATVQTSEWEGLPKAMPIRPRLTLS